MAATLTSNVVVRHPATGAPEVLLAGSAVPEWATGLVGGHVLSDGTGGDFDELDPDDPTRRVSGEDPVGDGPPPKAGRGSSAEAWRAYASAHGVELGDDASRDDVIAACEKAGVRTD